MKPSLVMAFVTTALFAQDSGTVVGRVIDSGTGFGIPGVAVEIKNPAIGSYKAVSDEAGAFRMTGVKYGDYGGSTAEIAGYDRHTDGPFSGSGVRVHGPDPVRLEILMDPWATLQGRVLDADGKPVAKVAVQLGQIYKETHTDEKGVFLFEELKPGFYALLAKPTPKDEIQEGARVEAVPTYFPSTVESSQAEKIAVRGGVDLPGYDIRLRTSPVYYVRGVVLNTAGKPAGNATVKLIRPGGQGTQGYGLGVMGATMSMTAGPAMPKAEMEEISGTDGKFEFSSVQPGDWRIEALADPLHDTVQDQYAVSTGGTSARVTGQDIEDAEIRLSAPFDLEFFADWGDAKPPEAGLTRRLMLMPLDGQPQPEYLEAGSHRWAHVLPGRYRMVPPLPVQRFYATSMLLGGREVLGQDVELTPGTPPLRIRYKTGGGSVRGTVENGEGSTVVLLSQDSPQEANGLSFVWTVKCGPGGAFDSGGVPPGGYYAVAFDRVEVHFMATEVATFLSMIRPNAVSVQVEEGSATPVDLNVTRWAR